MEKLEPCAPCWCGSGKAYKDCHCAFDEKYESLRHPAVHLPPRRLIKNEAQIEKIRRSAKVNIAVLDYVAEHIRPGVSTEEIDRWVYEQTAQAGAIPAPLNYEASPRASAPPSTSRSATAFLPRRTFSARATSSMWTAPPFWTAIIPTPPGCSSSGKPRRRSKSWWKSPGSAFRPGWDEVKPWEPLGNVGEAVHSLARKNGYTVVREVGGHGVGVEFHEDPFVSYVTRRGTGMIMAPGMIFTIEPMVNMGTNRIYIDADNDWTIYTQDGKPSAQWEIQVLVTETGHEVLAW